jgi:hypothetical protein
MIFSCQAWSTCAGVRERVCMREREREREREGAKVVAKMFC